ncbi:MAG: hypothetical protein HFJ05_02190 [Eubacterium sp.]|nr:hypothetical protein [Eubacterium sp.]
MRLDINPEIVNFVQHKPFAYIYGDEEPFICSEGKIYSIYESKLIDEESANEVCKEKDSRIRGSGSSFVEYFHIIEKSLQSIEYHGIEAFVTFNVYDRIEKMNMPIEIHNGRNSQEPVTEPFDESKYAWPLLLLLIAIIAFMVKGQGYYKS